MAEAKTKATGASVKEFIAAVGDAEMQRDSATLVKLMKAATRAEPTMWGASIIGFGKAQVIYAGGRTADWPLMGFSPRKSALALYGMGGTGRNAALVAKLGKCKTGKGCLYIKRLSDVALPVLKQLIAASAKQKGKSKG